MKITNIDIVWLRNFFSGLINRFTTIFAQVLLIPLFINLWGKEYYGEWLLISTLPAYLSASDLGLNVTATTAICALTANDKRSEALALYKSANKALLFLASIGLLLFSISCIYLNWSKIMGTKINSEQQIEISLLILISATFVMFLVGLAVGIYRSEGRFDKSQNFITLLQLFDAIIILVNVILGGNIFTVALSSFILKILFLIVIIIDLQKKYSWYKFGFNNPISEIYYLLPTSFFYMVALIGQGLVIQGTSFLIGKSLGPATLVTFNTIRTFINSIKSFINAFYSAYLPEFTKIIAQNKAEQARHLFIKMFIFTLTITTVFIITYYLLGNWIISIWTSNKVVVDNSIYVVMLVSIFFSTLSNCAYTVLNATNENRVMSIYYTIFALCAMWAIYVTSKNGLIYPVLFLCIVDFLMLVVTFNEAWKVVNGKIINGLG